MWQMIIRYPGDKPRRLPVKAGVITIGRALNNDVALPDTAVSRRHAQITYLPDEDRFLLRDLGSSNGSFVNFERLTGNQDYHLSTADTIQIGATEIVLEKCIEGDDQQQSSSSLEFSSAARSDSLGGPSDRIGLLCKVARHLSTVSDTETALRTVSGLLREALGADRCEVILASQFDRLQERGFSVTVASLALERRTAVLVPDASDTAGRLGSRTAEWPPLCSALCVPVLNSGNVAALVYLCKDDPDGPPFEETDLCLTETVGHMVAQSVERMKLLQRIHDEQRLCRLLQSQLTPLGTQHQLHDALKTGRLPCLGEEYATVLVTDIVDSTGWAERLGTGPFGRILRQYYHDMTSIVSDHGGKLNHYLGDGVMALFGISQDGPDPERCAVQASLEILDYFERHYRYSDCSMKMGIGINSGPVVAGYIDTEDRIEFAVLGDTVNVAFGLEAMARPNRIVIGQTTYQALQGKFPAHTIGSVTIKGRAAPVHVFEVLRPSAHSALATAA